MARPRSDIAPRILHAARARFLAQGVDGASLREIARDARTNIGMIYYYFPTKEALFLAVIEEVYAQMLRDMEVALAPDAPVDARLRRLIDRIAAMSDEEHTVLRLVIREALGSSEHRRALFARFSRGHLPLVLQTIMEGRATGAINAQFHPLALGLSMLGVAILPQVMLRLGEGVLPAQIPLPSRAELADAVAHVLLNGLSSAGAASPSRVS